MENYRFKFRAWDKKKNGWVSRNEWLGGALSPSINTISVCSVWQHFNIEIMQYTGSKDKNGVEIYEGDLLHALYDDGEINEVIWHEESASFRVATYLDNCHGGSFSELLFMDDIHENCNEVIGNIYENHELLVDCATNNSKIPTPQQLGAFAYVAIKLSRYAVSTQHEDTLTDLESYCNLIKKMEMENGSL